MESPDKSLLIRNRLLFSTVSNLTGKILVLSVGFFLTPFILHQLGAPMYGLFALVSSIVAYGSLLDFGFIGAITKYVAEYRARGDIEQVQSLIASALWMYSLLGLVAILLSVLFAPFFPRIFNVPPGQEQTAVQLVIVLGISVGVSIPCVAPVAILRGFQRFDLDNLITTLGTLLWAGSVAVVLLLGGGVLALAAVNIPVSLLMQIPGYWLVKKVAPQLHLSWAGGSRRQLRSIVPFSSSIFVLNLTTLLQTKTDEIVIGAFMPVVAVTPYAIARRLSEMPQLITDQFMKTLLPLASQLHAEDDRDRLRSVYLVGTRLAIALFLPLACVLIVLAGPLLAVWVGAEYARYSYLVVILTLASLVAVSQWPAGSVLQGMVRHQPLVMLSVATALANLMLSIALVGRWGLAGVAMGTLIPYTVESLFFVMPYAIRTIGISLRSVMLKVVLPALLPAIPALLLLLFLRSALNMSSLVVLLFTAGLGVLVYLLVYVVLNRQTVEVALGLETLRKAISRLRGRPAPKTTGETRS